MTVLRLPTARVFTPLLPPARYKGAYGGRGSAKSNFFAELMIERHIQERLDAVCLREVQKTLQYSSKKLLEAKIAAMNAGDYFDVQDKRILSLRGGVIIFQGLQSHTAESIKSLEGFDIGWVEEAQSLSRVSLDMLRPTIRKPGSELWFSWNPREPTDPVDELLRGDQPPPGTVVVCANWMDNPWFPDELRREMEYDRGRDPNKYAHIWLGHYRRNSEARVFRNWVVEEFETPSNATLRFGADWGFSVDPTVLVRCFIGRWEKGEAIADDRGRHLFIDFEAHEVGCEIDKTPALFDTVPDSRRWPIVADSARPETISYMRRNGFPKVAEAIKGARSVEEGVEFLKAYDIVVHQRCVHAIDELTLYSYEVDALTNKVTPRLADRNNNVIDALRYACEGARRAARAKQADAVVVKPRPVYSPFSARR